MGQNNVEIKGAPVAGSTIPLEQGVKVEKKEKIKEKNG